MLQWERSRICAYIDTKTSILVISKLCDITTLTQKLEKVKFHLYRSGAYG